MNTRKSRAKPKLKDDTPTKDILTPNSISGKKALFTPCRRLGLGRKKATQCSPVVPELKYENTITPIPSTTQNLEGPSTSQVTISPSIVIEEKPKSSASRRKKSSHPLKRTIEDTDKSEGNTYTVIVSPIPKKRKLEIIDIFNHDANLQNPSILIDSNFVNDNDKNTVEISADSVLPNDDFRLDKVECPTNIKQTVGVKVSLPLEISKKYLTTPARLTKSVKNDVSDTILKIDNSPLKDKKSEVNLNLCESTDIPVVGNSSYLETKPIKKRKVQEMSYDIEEINHVKENEKDIGAISETANDTEMIDNAEEHVIGKVQRKTHNKKINRNARTPKSKMKTKPISSKSKKKTLDLNNISKDVNESIIDDFDDDFMEPTPRNKRKINIKKKRVTVAKKAVPKKSKIEKVNDDCNKEITEKNKKNTRRKLNTNMEKLEESNLVEGINDINKYVNNTLTLSAAESEQMKSKNEKTNTFDKIPLETTSSNLNTTVLNDTSKEITATEYDLKTQPHVSEQKDISEGILSHQNQSEVSLPSPEKENCPEKPILPSEKNIVVKNKAEKKFYGAIELPAAREDKNGSALKNKDTKSPTKLSSRQLFKDSKPKMDDDELSCNEDSYESSHYSTPVYSPIEETAKLAEDRDLIIQRCDVIKLSPSKKNDVIYECHVQSPPSPEKMAEASVDINKECVSSFVEPSADEELNAEINRKENAPKKSTEENTIRNKNLLLNDSLESISLLAQKNDRNEYKNNKAVSLLPNKLFNDIEDDDFCTKKAVSSLTKPDKLFNVAKTPRTLRNSDTIIKKQLRSSKSLSVNNKVVDGKLEEMSNFSELKMASSESLLAPKKTELLNFYPRVLLDSNEIRYYYKQLELKRKKADEKIYKVNKTPPSKTKISLENKSSGINSRKRNRRNSEVTKIPEEKNFESHIQEKNFIISRVESFPKNDVSEKLKYKNNGKDIEQHTESVFFTPPSSRSENDSDSNRNDFQLETELLLINNPFGEGTSRQCLPKLTELDPSSKTSKITDTPTSQDETSTAEDREVASISSKGLPRKREKTKQKRKTTSKPSPQPSSMSNVTSDNFGFEYNSDDDFQTPRTLPKKMPSKTYTTKNESAKKCILKNEPCNRLEVFPLTDSSSITAIHRGQCIEYVKSTDNYANPPPKPLDCSSSESMIQKRCTYSSNRQPVSSIFDSVVDDPESYMLSQKSPPPRSQTHPLKHEVQEQIKEVEKRIKEKQVKLEHLNMINIYKKKHNFENLSKATKRMTKGAQEALLDLAAVLRQRSETPFDMGTLLDNMNVPHHVVGYNMDLDEFT